MDLRDMPALDLLRTGLEGGVKPERCQQYVMTQPFKEGGYATRCSKPPRHQLKDGTWECGWHR